MKKGSVFKHIVAALASTCLLTAQSLSAASYSQISPTKVEIHLNVAEVVAAAAPATEKAVGELIFWYKNNAIIERDTLQGNGATLTEKQLAPERRLLDDMYAELQFWDVMDSMAKTFGVGAVAGVAVYITGQLKQLNSLAPARLAAVLTAVTAVAAEGTNKVIAEKKKSLEAEIKQLSLSIKAQAKYLDWQADFGGEGTLPEPAECLIKETCREFSIYVTDKDGIPTREDRYECASEILSCRG